jgi:hypothetical protein
LTVPPLPDDVESRLPKPSKIMGPRSYGSVIEHLDVPEGHGFDSRWLQI